MQASDRYPNRAERENMLHTIAGNLATMRRERGWTQHELARRAGLNRNVVNTIENETSTPLRENLQRLCEALGCQPGDLTAPPGMRSIPEGFTYLRIDRLVPIEVATEIKRHLAHISGDQPQP